MRRGLGRDEWPWLAASGLAALLVAAPIAALGWFALQGSGELWPHLVANVLPHATYVTFALLIGVGAVISVVGVGTAWLVATCRFPGRAIFDWALLLPLAVPTYIVAYAYLDVLHPIGPVQGALRAMLGIANPRDLWFPEIRSLGGCIVVLGFVLYPYVYLPVRATFLLQSSTMLEAARTLGAGRARTFFRVALPLARPAVAVGGSLALMEALNDVGAPDFLGVRTLTVSIYSTWINHSSLEGAAQIAVLMLAVVVGLLALERWARRRQRFATHGRRARPTRQAPLSGLAALGAVLACALPIVVGFVIPASYLVVEAGKRIARFGLPADLPLWIANTFTFAAAATLLATAVGLVLAYTLRSVRHGAAPLLVRVACLGYAVPGTVLAVGLMTPLAAFDNAVDAFMRSSFGVATGLLVSGSGGALIIAYLVRFLAISAGGIESGLAKVSPSIDMAARSLGAGAAETVGRVHVPMIRPALVAAALLVFVDCMKELPATLLLRPFNFETLATHLYGEAVRGTYEDGAVAALAIVLVGLLPVTLLARASRLPEAEALQGRAYRGEGEG